MIEWKLTNPVTGEPYKAGDIMVCLFGIIYGALSFANIGPIMKVLIEGKIASKAAFEVIER